MKRNIIITILATLLISSCGYQRKPSSRQETGDRPFSLPAHVKLIGTTPVKNQGKSELCWAYGMLATIESEHIMKGDSINLSVAYIARMMLGEKAKEYYFSQGKKAINMRGMSSMLIHYINKYGAIPYDSYQDPKNVKEQESKSCKKSWTTYSTPNWDICRQDRFTCWAQNTRPWNLPIACATQRSMSP